MTKERRKLVECIRAAGAAAARAGKSRGTCPYDLRTDMNAMQWLRGYEYEYAEVERAQGERAECVQDA